MGKQPGAEKNHEPFDVLKDQLRSRLLKYTEKAFLMMPKMDKPKILDIGCGSGIPTLGLARFGQGEVIGIDIDQTTLDKFAGKIAAAGINKQVKAFNCSLFDIDFPEESFDVIWAEGAIHTIGFERGLREWRRLLKPGGAMVIHDEQGDVKDKLEQISDCGYELLDYFLLGEGTWRREYFAPLEKLLAEYQTNMPVNPKVLEEIRQAQEELDMFRKNPEGNSSVFFVMRRKH